VNSDVRGSLSLNRRPHATTPRDPDFDPSHRTERGPTTETVCFYQHLVVNPFLSLAALLLPGSAARWLNQVGIKTPAIWVLVVAAVFAIALIQYHCLDCGATGSYLRWTHHLCFRVRERWSEGTPRRFGFPSPTRQLCFWIVLCLAVGMLVGITRHPR